MKIYLLLLDDERCVFYSEGPETIAEDERSATPRAGFRGWVEQKYKNLQLTINGAEGGVGLHMRRAWEWLQKRTAPDEALLRSLRNASEINIYHPSSVSEDEARLLWANYLSNRRRRHTLWLAVNALISPLTVLLAPLPGPNIIGYWFLYRAICHLLARLGVRRAESDKVETNLHSSEALNLTPGTLTGEGLARIAEQFELKNLDAFIKRVAGKNGDTHGTRLAIS